MPCLIHELPPRLSNFSRACLDNVIASRLRSKPLERDCFTPFAMTFCIRSKEAHHALQKNFRFSIAHARAEHHDWCVRRTERGGANRKLRPNLCCKARRLAFHHCAELARRCQSLYHDL